MPASHTPDIIYEDLGTGNGLKILIKDNAEEKTPTIVIIIRSYYSETYNGLRASAEFLEGSNRIEDIKNIMHDKRFWSLIEYYQKKIIESLSKEELLFTDKTFAQDREKKLKQRTNFLADVARGVFSRSAFRTNRTLTADFLVGYDYICQRLNVYTSCRSDNEEEIIIARTTIGRSTSVSTYKNLTLFDAKLPNVFFYLHLANVILANRLILKQTRDLITGIEKAFSQLRSWALLYSLVIATVHGFIAYNISYSPTDTSLYNLVFNLKEPWPLVSVIILPLLWPVTAFCLRMYASKILSIIVRYTISRILNKNHLQLR